MKTQIKIAVTCFALLAGTGAFSQTLQDAIRFTDNEQYDKAATAFRALVATDPTNGDNLYYFGVLMLKTEETDSACSLFKKAVDINPTNPLSHAGMARCYFATGKAELANQELVYAKSLIVSQSGKKGTLTPQRQAVLYNEIAKSYLPYNPDAAIECTNQAERTDPKNVETFLIRGDALQVKDPVNSSTPIALYQKAAAMDPTSSKAWVRIGTVYAAGKNMPLAISYYNKALSIEPNFGPAYRNRGEAQYQLHKYDSASMSFQKYLELNNDCYSRYRYSAFLFKSGDYESAITQGQQVLACDSTITVMYRIIGRSYADMKTPDPAQAVYYINLFLQKADPKRISPDDYVYRGRALSKNKQDSLAIFDYQKAMQLDTNRKDIYFDFATSYFKMKKYDSAAVYYQKKIDNTIKPGLNDYFALGQAFYYANNFPQADSAFKKVTQMDPKNPMGWLWRGQTNAKMDPETKTDFARTYYETFYDLAIVDKEKNKAGLITASKYLGGYHYIHKNFGCAKAYFQFALELKPEDAALKKQLEEKELKTAPAVEIGTCKLPVTTGGSN
jgi:tetratricopeptide (TPR) repeat protein